MLCAHEEVLKRVQPSHMVEAFIPQYVPMLIKPVPWQRHDRGGHVTLRNNVMRLRGSHLQSEMLARADQDMVNGRGPGLSKVRKAGLLVCGGAWQGLADRRPASAATPAQSSRTGHRLSERCRCTREHPRTPMSSLKQAPHLTPSLARHRCRCMRR